MTNYNLRLRKGTIREQLNKFEYLVEDLFDKEIINMSISSKMKMVYPNFNIGEDVYVTVSPFEPNRGRLTTITSMKMNHELFGQKLKLDKKHKSLNEKTNF